MGCTDNLIPSEISNLRHCDVLAIENQNMGWSCNFVVFHDDYLNCLQWGGVLFEWIVFIWGLKRRHTKCLRKVPKEFQIWPGPTSINYEGSIVFEGSMPEPTSKPMQHIVVFSSFCIFVFKFLWRRKKDKCILWKCFVSNYSGFTYVKSSIRYIYLFVNILFRSVKKFH